MEFVLGGLAAVIANVFTNPLDVVKIRMQLQGELKARGQYTVHYRNVFHAGYAIAKSEGLVALQKGLVPSIWQQFVLNAVRLGAYQIAEHKNWTRDKDGKTTLIKSMFFGAVTGSVGAVAGSPMYLASMQI
jgi:solute carrier family 25 protein 34/35